jgi:uncharacterized protein YjiK
MFTRYLTVYINFRRAAGLLCFFLVVYVLSGCGSQASDDEGKGKYTNPAGYDLNRPVTFKLPQSLDEISGIVFNAKDKSVLAINDERGWLYKIHLRREVDLEKWQYYKGADFEDLVLVDSNFYVLESNGNIIQFKFITADSVQVKEHLFPAQGRNEFEILYHDKDKQKLILLCKDCEQDDKNSLSAFSFNLASRSYDTARTFVMDIRKIEELMDEKKVRFKPSAATINPLTKELYIVSAINDVLVVADLNGVPKEVHRVSPKIYKQPEGIAFTPQGDLLISNESADIGTANILYVKHKRTGTP